MDLITLDTRRGDGCLENLAALVKEGYEIATAHDGYVVMRKRGLRLVSQPDAPPAPPAADKETA